MHPNYQIHLRSKKQVKKREMSQDGKLAIPSINKLGNSLRNSCETAHTFFTLIASTT